MLRSKRIQPLYLLLFAGIALALVFGSGRYYTVRETARLDASNGEIIALEFSKDGRFLYSGSFRNSSPPKDMKYLLGGKVTRWDIESQETLASKSVHRSPAAMVLSPDEKFLFVGLARCIRPNPPNDLEQFAIYKAAKEVLVLDAQSLEEIAVITTGYSTYDMKVSPDGENLAIIGCLFNQLFVELYDIHSWQKVASLTFSGRPPTIAGVGIVEALKFSSDGKYLLAVTDTRPEWTPHQNEESGQSKSKQKRQLIGRVRVIYVDDFSEQGVLEVPGPIASLDLSNSDDEILFQTIGGTKVAKIVLPKVHSNIKPIYDSKRMGGPGGAQYGPDGKRVIVINQTAGNGKPKRAVAAIYRTGTLGNRAFKGFMPSFPSPVFSMAFCKEKNLLALGDMRGCICLGVGKLTPSSSRLAKSDTNLT